MKSKIKLLPVVLMISACCFAQSESAKLTLRVSAPNVDCVDVPVHAVIELPEQFARVPAEQISVVLKEKDRTGSGVPGQIVTEQGEAQLWWVLPQAKARSTSTWTATLKRRERADSEAFSWKDKKGEYLDLLFNSRNVTRYMYAYDKSTPQRTFETYKTFHHVFDAQGENLLTNGPDGVHSYTRKITYPHHRGIFIGWNGLEFEGKRYDFWHMGGAAQKHQKFLQQTAGPVLAKSTSLIHWIDNNAQTIIAEQREVTVFRQSDPTILLLDFCTELKAVGGDVLLNGDPEHAGMQYRPHNDVASGSKDVKAAYLFHKDGINPKKDKDLPWAAMSYGLNDRRYSVLYMDHPDNPKPTIYSAYRDYGRFGAFFKQKINAGQTLTLNYCIWVVEGKMPERQVLAGKYSAFVDSPKVEVMQPGTSGPDSPKFVPLPIELPRPMFVGTPQDTRVPNLEKPLGKLRPPFYAPVGTKNIALGKPVTGSDEQPIIGELEMVTDGDKEAMDGSYVELGPFVQCVTIDLEAEHDIYAILFWHFHKQARVYFDVVVQVADDPDFITNVRTLFNNDTDNSSGLGIGSHMHYTETNEGKLIDAKGVRARYVRLYSKGNSSNDLNHYIELEVYGKPPK